MPCCPLRDQCGPKKKGPEWRRSITRSEDPAATCFQSKMETEEAKESTANDRRSPSSRTPGSKSDVDSGNFDAADKEGSMEATWACLSYNIIRWFSIRRKLNAILAA